MKISPILATGIVAAAATLITQGCGGDVSESPQPNIAANAQPDISAIKNVVVIYAENRSFDNLYGYFPGANGLQNASAESKVQLDRNGQPLATLPVSWGGLTQRNQRVTVTEAQTANMPNRPFSINDPNGLNVPLSVATRDLYHRFYENQMQINGGKNNMFVAWADSGGPVMGHYITNAQTLPLWKVAQRYTLADNFFMGAFGGSFLNHQWLVCACTPTFPNALRTNAAALVSVVEADGVTLTLDAKSPASAMTGKPMFKNSGSLTPDLYAVNTMQPPYQPSDNAPATDDDVALADPNPSSGTTLPPQTATHIGDLLNDAGVSWAWYGGAWGAALKARRDDQWSSATAGNLTSPNFQTHHQPFNYFANLAPGSENRAQHLLDGGMNGSEFIYAIDTGTLPQIAFYKPQGNLNEHAGYTDVGSGDEHIADLIRHLEKSPQWSNMLVIVTYDENGGFWDHVAPPKGDRWGPGSRIPALIVSPFAKQGFVDHTQYDTTSILRFITRRFSLPALPGLSARDKALVDNGGKPMGDLTGALNIKL